MWRSNDGLHLSSGFRILELEEYLQNKLETLKAIQDQRKNDLLIVIAMVGDINYQKLLSKHTAEPLPDHILVYFSSLFSVIKSTVYTHLFFSLFCTKLPFNISDQVVKCPGWKL
jgi:hypothetical protein